MVIFFSIWSKSVSFLIKIIVWISFILIVSLKEKFQSNAKGTRASSIVKISWRFWCSTKMVARRTTLALKHREFCASIIFFLLVPESISFVLFKFSTSRLKHNYLKLILVRMIFTIFWSSQCSSCWKVF